MDPTRVLQRRRSDIPEASTTISQTIKAAQLTVLSTCSLFSCAYTLSSVCLKSGLSNRQDHRSNFYSSSSGKETVSSRTAACLQGDLGPAHEPRVRLRQADERLEQTNRRSRRRAVVGAPLCLVVPGHHSLRHRVAHTVGRRNRQQREKD